MIYTLAINITSTIVRGESREGGVEDLKPRGNQEERGGLNSRPLGSALQKGTCEKREDLTSPSWGSRGISLLTECYGMIAFLGNAKKFINQPRGPFC